MSARAKSKNATGRRKTKRSNQGKTEQAVAEMPLDGGAPAPDEPQSKTLVIVESGAKADTISEFLDDSYTVEACFGHVRDLPRRAAERPAKLKGKDRPHWADLAVDVDNGFEPHYIVPAENQEQIAKLRKELKAADRLLLATDEDREGESIGWHLAEVLKPKVPYERIVFHEITREAIDRALQEPREIDEDLVEAQESRRILDRLFGYSLSPVLWRKVGQGASAGRVQSVALRFLVDRERERMAFKIAEYGGANAEFSHEQGGIKARLASLGGQQLASGTADFDPATGQLSAEGKRHETVASLRQLQQPILNASWEVASVDKRRQSKRPPAPFTTSTLQQTAGNRLGYSARQTMTIAQRLYQGIDIGAERTGLITYMRTDSVTLADQALNQAQQVVSARFGDEYSKRRIYTTRSRNAQEAHEAIRPTDLSRTPDELRGVLEDGEWRLYDLIWRHTIASQMSDARVEQTRITLKEEHSLRYFPQRNRDHPAVMTANGQVVLFHGWYKVLPPGGTSAADDVLPPVDLGNSIKIESFTPTSHVTTPPPRYTEASLVKKLEEDGLGRPSTYASIISTLVDRRYASRRSRQLAPTFLGMAVADLLTDNFPDLVETEFTAAMEDQLDRIARGESESVDHLHEFYFGGDEYLGVKALVDDKIKSGSVPFWALEVGEDGLNRTEPDLGDDPSVASGSIQVRVKDGEPFLSQSLNGERRTVSLPADFLPADLNRGSALKILETAKRLPLSLGHHRGNEVLLLKGRYGLFVQEGETPPKARRGKPQPPQPKRASVPKDMEIDDVTLKDAIEWLRWPKALGHHPDSGKEVWLIKGRFGPFVQEGETPPRPARGKPKPPQPKRASVPQKDKKPAIPLADITLEDAIEWLRWPKTLGQHPDNDEEVRVRPGRWGPYVQCGDERRNLDKDKDDLETITLERALELLAQPKKTRGRKGGSRRRASDRRR